MSKQIAIGQRYINDSGRQVVQYDVGDHPGASILNSSNASRHQGVSRNTWRYTTMGKWYLEDNHNYQELIDMGVLDQMSEDHFFIKPDAKFMTWFNTEYEKAKTNAGEDPPLYGEGTTQQHYYAFFEWMKYWVEWAVKNCTDPIIWIEA